MHARSLVCIYPSTTNIFSFQKARHIHKASLVSPTDDLKGLYLHGVETLPLQYALVSLCAQDRESFQGPIVYIRCTLAFAGHILNWQGSMAGQIHDCADSDVHRAAEAQGGICNEHDGSAVSLA